MTLAAWSYAITGIVLYIQALYPLYLSYTHSIRYPYLLYVALGLALTFPAVFALFSAPRARLLWLVIIVLALFTVLFSQVGLVLQGPRWSAPFHSLGDYLQRDPERERGLDTHHTEL